MPFSAKKTTLAPLAVLAALGLAGVADAQQSVRTTSIASPADANGSSDNTTFSQDNRLVRLMAFDSGASNLVPGDGNGRRDVILFSRGGGLGNLAGGISRVSVGAGGREGNGDSTKPSIDGDTKRAPHCVTFQSTASNLAKGDSSADSDIFMRELRGNRTSLVSVGHSNARNAVIDGECDFVTYEAGGAVFVRDLEASRTYRLASGSNPDQQTNGKGVVYERGGQVYHQAFQKVNLPGGRGRTKGIRRIGRPTLVSAGTAGAGNGASRNPSADDNGHYVAFESTATNLCLSTCRGVSEDRNGPVSDVFRRTISRRAPTNDRMQMVSYSAGVNEQGNGPSNNPSMTGAGENVAFDSAATNLRQNADTEADPNGATRDIFYWNFPRRRGFGNVSRESRPAGGGEFNGASTNPGTSNRSNYIGFTSAQTGQAGEANGGGIEDVFIRFLGGGPAGSVDG